MHDVHLKNHVVIHEIREGFLIGDNTADLRRREKYILRFFLRKEILDRVLAGQVELLMCARDDVGVALPLQLALDCGADHSAVARHINFCIFFHHLIFDPFIRRLHRPFSPEQSAKTQIPEFRFYCLRSLVLASASAFLRSESAMIFTSSSKLVFCGFQPSFAFAFVGSPSRFTTSVGR